MKLMKKLDYEARSAFIVQIVAEVKYFFIMFLIQFSKFVSLKTSLIKCLSILFRMLGQIMTLIPGM